MLARQGLVRHDVQRGVVVFTPSEEDVRENYELRIALEPLATEIAARTMTDPGLECIDRVSSACATPPNSRSNTWRSTASSTARSTRPRTVRSCSS